ncbi:MAG: hypothetical protein R8J94_05985 [Acidimicrobiia bacterium]|nr:hypothetical protein [Acidimicrobiia bacterium]
MSTEPFTDEILSAIIDGEADDETVAAVAADRVATARLAQLRNAVDMVATPVPDATPERRSASIAAAMAAATPASPEVTSLAAARHERTAKTSTKSESTRQWFVLAAAAIALVVAIPLALQLRSGNDADVATADDTSADATDSRSLATDDAVDDTADAASDEPASDEGAEEGLTAEAMADESLDMAEGDGESDDAMEESEEPADDADSAADDAPATTAPAEVGAPTISPAAALADATTVNSLESLESLLAINAITPTLTLDVVIDAVVEAGLSPECAESLEETNPPSFALASLSEGGGETRLLILQFDEDTNAITLDAEDCAQLG